MAANAAMEADLAARFERLPQLVDDDPWLLRRGRWLSVDMLVELGSLSYYLAIDRGRVASLERGPLPMRSWRLAVRGSAEGWHGFWEPMPAPGDHDLFALAKRGAFRIEGDLQPLMANIFYIKALLAAPRRLAEA